MDDLTLATAVELADAIADRRVSAVEVLEAYLSKIARHNPALNAIVTLDEAGSSERAREADAAIARGERWGPLHGVPVTLKDVHVTAGMRSTCGHPRFVDHVPPTDSGVPARLKRAGAILLGKTNVDLFPDNPFGLSNNPWNLERTTGGSSSGAAAAVAARLSPLDIGSDAGGSILEPAHYCGIFGLRPTEHRVSVSGMVWLEPVSIWHILMALGPMGRSAQDVRLAMQVIAGPEGRDYNVPPLPWRQSPRLAVHDLRIAWAPTLGSAVASDIRDTIEGLAREVARMGARVEERLPAVDLAQQARLSDALFGQLVGAFGPRPDGAPPVALDDHLLALDRRAEFIAAWDAFFTDWDALLCPVRAVTAPRHADRGAPVSVDGRVVPEEDISIPLLLAATTGHPAIAIPAGRDRDGLPIGVQLIGRRWDDERLIAIAEILAAVTGGYQPPPGY